MDKRTNKPTVSKLKKKLDAIFSKYIRKRDNYTCFTCGIKKVEGERGMQNGHFIPRQYNNTRYDERNCNAQCYACNMLYGGQPDIYALRLQEKYGEGILKELNATRNKVKQWTVPELEKLIEEYKQKL